MTPANRKHVDIFIAFAKEGRFGTPDAPLKNGGERWGFWAGYFGWRKPSEYYGSLSYSAVKAGAICRKNNIFNQLEETEQ